VTGYLLDTNVVSELRKGERMDPHVAAWHAQRDRRELYLSVITLAELRRGIHLIGRRDKKQGAVLGTWCDRMQREYGRAGHLLSFRAAEAEAWAELAALRPLPVMDALIAATAKSHDLILVTRNTSDFKGLGMMVENPFAT